MLAKLLDFTHTYIHVYIVGSTQGKVDKFNFKYIGFVKDPMKRMKRHVID